MDDFNSGSEIEEPEEDIEYTIDSGNLSEISVQSRLTEGETDSTEWLRVPKGSKAVMVRFASEVPWLAQPGGPVGHNLSNRQYKAYEDAWKSWHPDRHRTIIPYTRAEAEVFSSIWMDRLCQEWKFPLFDYLWGQNSQARKLLPVRAKYVKKFWANEKPATG